MRVRERENGSGSGDAGESHATMERWVGGVVPPGLAFAYFTLIAPVEVRGESVNALAQRVADFFLGRLRGERIDAAWPCGWSGPAEIVGLGRRVSAVEAAFG